ncbi:MAG TPA: RagB/SusD family nutrient uptake outer membrane protein [Chitinophaga sp.]|uniref:RagB/SusD family nutrient uptake outer membrane protein n=1 Tax=Chitinophaga sp. TaxID=1869181 RepID=UPI002B50EED8|nr:RagB/SusD family nutrient uptake outer membrane protein [Chitinophaga sp.]HVI46496.1 RagB/SusD family nutrient uptake outer membrane protein [Chitinophaga sp.]
MRRIQIIYTFALLAVSLLPVSCKKYLDTPSDNLRTPKTVADYAEMLRGEGWAKIISPDNDISLYFLDMMTTDVQESAGQMPAVDEKAAYSAFYTWQNVYDAQYDERRSPSSLLNNTWLGLYRIVKTCNIITDKGDDIQGATADRQFLLGEACFSRALAYFYLVNIWGTPYDPSTTADSMGIPLISGNVPENAAFPRSNVHVVYDKILTDLNEALRYATASGKTENIFHYSPAAIYLLLSRVHLYLQHWQQAAVFADKCLALNSALKNVSNKKTSLASNFVNSSGTDNREVIYTFYNDLSSPVLNIFGNGSDYGFTVSDELLQLYSPQDSRTDGCFFTVNNITVPKAFLFYNNTYMFSFRTAEAYLNRAEANAHLGLTGSALTDINLLQSHRAGDATPVNITDQQKLLEEILLQRRKELAFQLHNWFDLRRTDKPRMAHYFTPVIKGQVQPKQLFVLEKDDPGYTLEIPARALQANPVLRPLGLQNRIPR